MYLQTSRLQYNLQNIGVFQTAHSDKNIQALACKCIIPHNCERVKWRQIIICSNNSVENRQPLKIAEAGIEKWKKQKLIIDKEPNVCYNIWCVKRKSITKQRLSHNRKRACARAI